MGGVPALLELPLSGTTSLAFGVAKCGNAWPESSCLLKWKSAGAVASLRRTAGLNDSVATSSLSVLLTAKAACTLLGVFNT